VLCVVCVCVVCVMCVCVFCLCDVCVLCVLCVCVRCVWGVCVCVFVCAMLVIFLVMNHQCMVMNNLKFSESIFISHLFMCFI
jgi:hypothetical protein